MARACILNYNGRGEALLTKLKAEGRIERFENVLGTPRWCFEFTKTLTIDFSDYLDVAPSYMKRDNAHTRLLLEEFKDAVILPIINSIRGGEVMGFSDTFIELEDTSRTAIVCVKLTRKERELLEEEAEKQGVTLSELIRERVLRSTQS